MDRVHVHVHALGLMDAARHIRGIQHRHPREDVLLVQRLDAEFGLQAAIINGSVRFEHPEGAELVAQLMRSMPDQIDSITVSHPTLEDVFIHMTGHYFGEGPGGADRA